MLRPSKSLLGILKFIDEILELLGCIIWNSKSCFHHFNNVYHQQSVFFLIFFSLHSYGRFKLLWPGESGFKWLWSHIACSIRRVRYLNMRSDVKQCSTVVWNEVVKLNGWESAFLGCINLSKTAIVSSLKKFVMLNSASKFLKVIITHCVAFIMGF